MSSLYLRSINLENLLQTILLVIFSYYLYYALKTEEILLYLHPRLIPFLYFSMMIMILFALFSFISIYKIPRKRLHPITYTLFFIPLLFAILIPPRPIDSQSLAGRRIQGEIGVQESRDRDLFPVAEGIRLEEKTFSPWFYELYRDPLSYQGNPIRIQGFLHREGDLGREEFYMARFLMVCCVADMQLIGLLGSHPKASLYNQDEWVELKGILEIFYDNGRPLPFIQGEEIERIERPEVPYIYPSLYLPED